MPAQAVRRQGASTKAQIDLGEEARLRTLLFTRADVQALLQLPDLVRPLRDGFVAYSANTEQRAQRVRSTLPGPGSATVLFPGTTPGVPAYTVKVHAKFEKETPAIRGVLCLHDSSSGALLAVMDSTYLTAARTGVAGALAAHVLGRPDADTAAVIGAGAQGTFQLRALAMMRTLRHVWVYDTLPERGERFAETMAGELGVSVLVTASAASAVQHAGLVLVATWSRTPFLSRSMLAPGAHITTLGPDEPGKAEVDADLIRTGLFVCDDRRLAVELGAVGGAGLGSDAVDAELGDVLAGTHSGRTSNDQITIYGGVGLAFQDAVAAWCVYQNATARGIGREIDFLM
jgi:ornithine cyclodeaminase/alanine dehydrogenase-like protein (mu-crystallin family)